METVVCDFVPVEKKISINISIAPELRKRLEEGARRRYVSVSAYASTLLALALEAEKDAEKRRDAE